jgi:hypothetical protein
MIRRRSERQDQSRIASWKAPIGTFQEGRHHPGEGLPKFRRRGGEDLSAVTLLGASLRLGSGPLAWKIQKI